MIQAENETIDSIKDIRIIQSKTGYRFSIDAVILENFITLKKKERCIELGAGSGVISMLLARKHESVNITGVEIQKALAERAEKNVRLNGLEGRVGIIRSDIMKLKESFPSGKADVVFSNPPFRKPKTGRLSHDDEKAAARHELKITLPGLIKTASRLLKEKGRFYLIYHPFRLVELITLLQEARLEPKKIRFVHPKKGEEAKMALIESVKGAGRWLKVSPPLFIHAKDDEYTAEIKEMLGR
ncbi:MAG: tRNA1(Val) (adenine(37)-N6)-methyltransferase [Nitrospirae bacterium]|nr:tRNA1(Val) (adenine(37)-N6)-methyltransferase [Nitrospirota bacterium]